MADFVGYCRVEVADDQLGLTFPVAVLYPTHTPAETARVDLYTLDVAVEAPLKQGVFPLVLISHGTGGSPLVYRTLAHHLAATASSLVCRSTPSTTGTTTPGPARLKT